MGGTFDPPHLGHLYAAKAAYEQAHLDYVLFLPNGTPAYKTTEGHVTDRRLRCGMLQCLIEKEAWCGMSTMECDREGNTYTADTLRQLTREHPEISYRLIVGSDSLKAMDHWYHPEIIFRLAGVIVLLRDEDTTDSLKAVVDRYEADYGARIQFVSFEKQEISSTQIRQKAKNGEPLTGLVPPKVEQYIIDHEIYTLHEGEKQ